MPLPAILVISLSNLATDPRVNRQLRLLAPNYQVTAAGFADPGIDGVEFVKLPSSRKTIQDRFVAAARLKLGRFAEYYWNVDSVRVGRDLLQNRSFDVIIANDANSWPLAVAIQGTAQLLFDAHEYAPKEFEDILWWRIFHQPFKTYLCREYLGKASSVLTVCPGIADEYQKVFGIRPHVVMNAPPNQPLSPSPGVLNQIRMIHHGGATPSRKIENMIGMFDYLDERFSLDLILVANDVRYLQKLKKAASGHPKIRFLDPIPMREIPTVINRYDVGLYLLEPNSFNNLHALPNKFFEFIQARLAVAIGPSPEMANLVNRYECGVVANDFTPQTLAASLRSADSEKIAQWKEKSDMAARELCWEHESQVVQREVARLVSLRKCAA
jgi:hypothetical protein